MRARHWAGILIAAAMLSGCNPGFSEDDIAAAKKSIKEEFEKKPGVTVSEVTLLKESNRKLTGYIKARYMGQDVMKSCSATMDEGGRNYLWRCD